MKVVNISKEHVHSEIIYQYLLVMLKAKEISQASNACLIDKHLEKTFFKPEG